MRAVILALAMSIVAASAWAADTETIGSIKTVQGQVGVIRHGQVIPAGAGQRVERQDILKTGADSSVGVILRDESLLSLGANSELHLQQYAFSPAEGKLAFVTRLVMGTAAYLSGKIGKLAPQSVRFETPVATIGLRGTRFAVKLEENQ